MTFEVIREMLLAGSLKGGLFTLVGGLLAWRWKRAAAADQHTLWLLVLASFLILPLLQLWGPKLALLPSQPTSEIRDKQRPLAVDALPPSRGDSEMQTPVISEVRALRESPGPQVPWWGWAWFAGVLVMSGKAFLGRLILWRVGKASENGRIQVLASQLRMRLGITRSVKVVLGKRLPMTWGWRHPSILLPVEALTWEEERLRAVLLHELAHVKRQDALAQCLLQVVTALYWFHPFVWFASWRLISERERACDQAVLDAGVKPSVYARALMGVALENTPSAPLLAAGMGMARQGELEKRLRTILERPRHGRIKQRWLLATVFGWASLAFPLGFLAAKESESLEAVPPTLESDLLAVEESTAAIEAALDAKQSDLLRPRYFLELEKLEDLKTKYGARHPELIRQQNLVDSMKALLMPPSSPGDRLQLRARYDRELEKLNELGTKYLDRHPKVMKQKALVREIGGHLNEIQEEVRVASPVSGIVSESRVARNQTVKKGSVLLILDQRRARLAVESALVRWQAAKRKVMTVSTAVNAGDTLPVKLEDAESELHLAKAALEAANIELADHTIRAPFDGIVLDAHAKVGEYVTPENPVVLLKPKRP